VACRVVAFGKKRDPMFMALLKSVVYLLIFEAMLMVGLVYLMQQLVMLLSV